MGYYDTLSPFQSAMASFSHEISIVAALEVSGKVSEEEAYKRIRSLYKKLKRNRKELKSDQSNR
jgi:hypothetical protein